MPIVLISGCLNLLEPSGPFQACNGIVLLLPVLGSVDSLVCFLRKCGRVKTDVSEDRRRQRCTAVQSVMSMFQWKVLCPSLRYIDKPRPHIALECK